MAKGFHAFKLKVGSRDGERDVRRAFMLRELAGADALIMLDANQQWTLPRALADVREASGDVSVFSWRNPRTPTIFKRTLRSPTRSGRSRLRWASMFRTASCSRTSCRRAPCRLCRWTARGWLVFLSFITVSLLARKFGLRVIPHVGDMGQIHQHLVLFNHIALGHEAVFLECIPHLQPHFVNPAQIENGVYVTSQAPGSSSDLKGVHPGA